MSVFVVVDVVDDDDRLLFFAMLFIYKVNEWKVVRRFLSFLSFFLSLSLSASSSFSRFDSQASEKREERRFVYV